MWTNYFRILSECARPKLISRSRNQEFACDILWFFITYVYFFAQQWGATAADQQAKRQGPQEEEVEGDVGA